MCECIIPEGVFLQQFYQFFVFSNGENGAQVFFMVQICTDEVNELMFYQPFGSFLDMPAIITGKGKQVHLQVATPLFESVIFF